MTRTLWMTNGSENTVPRSPSFFCFQYIVEILGRDNIEEYGRADLLQALSAVEPLGLIKACEYILRIGVGTAWKLNAASARGSVDGGAIVLHRQTIVALVGKCSPGTEPYEASTGNIRLEWLIFWSPAARNYPH